MAKAKTSIVLKSFSNSKRRLVIKGFKVLILPVFNEIIWNAGPLT